MYGRSEFSPPSISSMLIASEVEVYEARKVSVFTCSIFCTSWYSAAAP